MTIYILVEFIGLKGVFQENIANIISTEISFVIAFILHRSITWRSKVRGVAILGEFLKFHLISFANLAGRIGLFYYISHYAPIGYMLNTVITVILVIFLNFVFYKKLFQKQKR